MKKKLKTVFILIVLSLAGIIVFQSYWTFNSYKVNKERFDGNIDSAMRLAMEDCKKDYFDSMRVVLVKKLSAPDVRILIDTIHEKNTINLDPIQEKNTINLNTIQEKNTINEKYNFWFVRGYIKLPITFGNHLPPGEVGYLKTLNHKLSILQAGIKPPSVPTHKKDNKIHFEIPFTVEPSTATKVQLDFYRKKILHQASLPEVLTEMSFYEPRLMDDFKWFFLMDDNFFNLNVATKHSINTNGQNDSTIVVNEPTYKRDENSRLSDSIRLTHYLNQELVKANIRAGFKLILSSHPTLSQKTNLHYGETNEYLYKYNGLVPFNMTGPEFYARAIFRSPQYAVLKSMVITLTLSLLLIALTIYCFLYITRTILEQKKLAELKDDFINNMTHELKTPIATITVAIEGLQKFNALNDPEKTKRYLQTSRDELNRLNELVSKVLNMAVFENKEITLVKEKINVDELVNDVISSEKSKTTKTVNITYTNKDVETIEADKFHFRNVLVNLVDNAIKYSDEPADISITCYKAGNNAVFSVKDKGIGIPPEHISQVFDKFHRVPTGNIHDVKGTGLGLSYVKYIVEAHGGNVTVKSEINAGSEFIVTLP